LVRRCGADNDFHVSWRERAAGVLACGGVSPLFSIAFLFALAAPTIGLGTLIFEGEAELMKMLADIGKSISTTSFAEVGEAVLMSIYGMSWLTVHARWMIAAIPFLIGLLAATRAALRRQELAARPPDEMIAASPIPPRLARRDFDIARALSAFLQWLFYLAACGMWFLTLLVDNDMLVFYLLTFAFFLVNAIWLGYDWSAHHGRREAARHAILRHRRALSAALLVGSALYLLCLLLALPLRQKADARMNFLLQKGEVAAMRLDADGD